MQGCAQRVASGAPDSSSDVEAAQKHISSCSQGHDQSCPHLPLAQLQESVVVQQQLREGGLQSGMIMQRQASRTPAGMEGHCSEAAAA